jgi:cation diffusion facilitator family transporter
MARYSYKYAKRGAWAGIIVKLVLAAGFGAAGLAGRSTGLLAAAADSVGDVLSSIVVLVGLTVAAALPDREHPYGHGKAEPVAGKAVAIVLIIMGLSVLWRSLAALIENEGHLPPEAFTIVVAACGALVHEALYRYENSVGKKVRSISLQATAWNHRTDALGSVVALIGVAGARLGARWAFMDHAAGVVISLMILYVGMKLFRQASLELMDTRLPDDQMADIRSIIENVDEVLGVDMIRARKSGLVIFLDVHIEVDKKLSVEAGHNIASLVRKKVRSEMPEVADVLVHVEPYYERKGPEGP